MTPSEQIKEKIISLESALLAQHPSMPTLLRDIWQQLKSNPDCVTLLDETEIGVIVNGLQKQTATQIATVALKSKGKSLRSITASDL